MHFSTLTWLAAVPLFVLAAPQQPQPQITAAPEGHRTTTSLPTQTPSPGEAWKNQDAANVVELELRQATVQDPLATKAAEAVPTTLDYWMPDHWDTAESKLVWSHFFYTQTFASAPGLWTTAGAGEIGLGTHTGVVGVVKEKTGAAAKSTLAQGSLVTAAVALVGVVAGMGVVWL